MEISRLSSEVLNLHFEVRVAGSRQNRVTWTRLSRGAFLFFFENIRKTAWLRTCLAITP